MNEDNKKIQTELPAPHDMLLEENKKKLLRAPTFLEKYPMLKWIILIIIVFIVFAFIVFSPFRTMIDQNSSNNPTPTKLKSKTPEVVNLVRLDLAKKLGVELSQVKIKSYIETEWKDTSLGCPEPGMSYLQVITPGYKVVLESKQKEYQYNTDTSQTFTECSN